MVLLYPAYKTPFCLCKRHQQIDLRYLRNVRLRTNNRHLWQVKLQLHKLHLETQAPVGCQVKRPHHKHLTPLATPLLWPNRVDGVMERESNCFATPLQIKTAGTFKVCWRTTKYHCFVLDVVVPLCHGLRHTCDVMKWQVVFGRYDLFLLDMTYAIHVT